MTSRSPSPFEPGAVIGGGPPLADTTAFGQWKAARRLVEHGARTTLWHAAALGLTAQIEGHLAGRASPDRRRDHAGVLGRLPRCPARRRRAPARPGRRPQLGRHVGRAHPLDTARRSEQDGLDPTELVAWLLAQGAKSASEVG